MVFRPAAGKSNGLDRTLLARRLMDEFAGVTGLEGDAPPRRYLWTDAFAVGNFLGLHRATGDGRYLDLALNLVEQVHHVLGRYRPDDRRRGWLSGLSEEEGEVHPTAGGLRIGKPLPERTADEPFDAQLEWERDGQYFHYLTQWMSALRRVSEETGQPIFRRWAVELARAAHARFVVRDERGRPDRMVWKRSVDLARVLVPSTGQHDPLEAWLTAIELDALPPRDSADVAPALSRERAEAAVLCARTRWETDDPLGIGALLVALFRVERLFRAGVAVERTLADRLVADARTSLALFVRSSLELPAVSRLAFRELGLALGLEALARVASVPAERADRFVDLGHHHDLAERIERFWAEPARRRVPSWTEHADINGVMLATSLLPDGYLGPLLVERPAPFDDAAG